MMHHLQKDGSIDGNRGTASRSRRSKARKLLLTLLERKFGKQRCYLPFWRSMALRIHSMQMRRGFIGKVSQVSSVFIITLSR